EMIEHISNKKLLLMASNMEGLPMSIAESLSVGVPVISTDTGDIARAVQDDYNGYLVPVNFKSEDYASRIQIVLENYDEFAKNALQSSEIFKAENVAKKLISDIKMVLGHRE